MAIQRHLNNPPLKEALIDFAVAAELPPDFVERLSRVSLPGLENKKPIRTRQFQINFGPISDASVRDEEIIGYRFESSDASRVVQLRVNGMTYSILKGYTDFPDLRDTAHRAWQVYLDTANTQVLVKRMAARYINVLEYGHPIELNDYLTAAPQVPKELPQTYLNFFQSVVVQYTTEMHAVIQQASEPSFQPGAKIILDIDAIVMRDVQGDTLELWNIVDGLRELKNKIFFSSVTDAALERYA